MKTRCGSGGCRRPARFTVSMSSKPLDRPLYVCDKHVREWREGLHDRWDVISPVGSQVRPASLAEAILAEPA